MLWNDYETFEKVYMGDPDQIAWSEKIDLCPDAMYVQLTKKTVEDIFPNLKEMQVDP